MCKNHNSFVSLFTDVVVVVVVFQIRSVRIYEKRSITTVPIYKKLSTTSVRIYQKNTKKTHKKTLT